MKKFISAVITLSTLLSFAVIPAHAEGLLTENWAQYERGFYTSSDKFKECLKVTTDTSYDDGQIISVRMVANTSSKVTSTKNPVAYKYGQNAADYGTHENDTATYAHMRLYLATFDDANHNMFDDFYLRMDKDGTGSSRDAFLFDNWKWDGEVYAVNYTSSAAYTTKDWCGILKQGYNGNGPSGSTAAADCDSPTRVLSDSDYNKLDIIVEYNKQGGATTYLFVDGKFMADYYDSGLTDKHFHGIVFRTLENKTPRNNSSYIAVKFDPSRIGHREYYNTENYMVTLEDVMQDAGLGAENIDSTMIYKTKAGDLEWYMPGNNQVAYHYPNKLIDGSTASARLRIGENITYSGTAATITASNTGSSYEMAARMLAGFYPINGKCGIAYESYHPRAKYIKLSFDQTISNDGMWLEYASYYSGKVQALQMWNNGGYLVAGVVGSGENVTCNGAGSKPTATITGTNHIDWLLEPDEDNNCVNQYVYVNGKCVGSGHFGNEYAVRINDIILSTKNGAGTVTIDNWSMTVYNDTAEFEDTDLAIPSNETEEIAEPNYENYNVFFSENFEGKTASSLASTYPRTKRIDSGTCISYWGSWDSALATGFNGSRGIYACAGVASNNSRTLEVYAPTDASPQKGLVNIRFNIKPQASLSKQNLSIFRQDRYSDADDGDNGVLLFDNADIKAYKGSWLDVNIWIDLDNDTYLYIISNTETEDVIKQGRGTQKFNNVGGFVLKLKGSDSAKDFSQVAPIIDNICFASANIHDKYAFGLKSFSFSGSSADINFEVGDKVKKPADVYMALYGSDRSVMKGVSKNSVIVNNATKSASFSVNSSNAESGDLYRLLLFDAGTLKPIFASIDSDTSIYPDEIGENVDLRTSTMRAFFADSNSNCRNYADGSIAAEEPLPVTFSWLGDSNCSYVLKVSESSNMSNPWTFETSESSYDVYNLKIATRYYWTVSAVKNNSTVYTTPVQTFTTIDALPRTLLIGGSIRNARDIGGWRTTNGKRVKQGLVFRSSALDTWDNDMDRQTLCVSPGGINTMKNLLGIKTEIDLRQGHSKEENFPDGKTTSILGSGVSYYQCPMIAENFFANNSAAVKDVFAIFANANNYPITYHCAVGADRTGFVTYLLNGLLGVSKEDLTRDYLLTNFSYQSKYRAPITDSYVATLDNYTGSTLQQKIYNYLKNEIGVPTSQLDFIINYLTE